MAKPPLRVDTFTHDKATRRNAPTAELEAFVPAAVKAPVRVAYERRNPDLDPQLVWRGKDGADWSDLIVEAAPLYIQEKIHPKALVESLKRERARTAEPGRARSVRGFQRAGARSAHRVLRARPALVEPHDPGRRAEGDGVAGGARGAEAPGAVHLHRPAVRHQVQQQLPVEHHQRATC